jgi:hypothetical protein
MAMRRGRTAENLEATLMAEFNSSADAVEQTPTIPKERWHQESREAPKPFSIAVRLLGLLALALVIAGSALLTALLETAQLLRGHWGVGR